MLSRTAIKFVLLLLLSGCLRGVFAAPGDILFSDDFESGFGNWTAAGAGDASIGGETFNSASNSMRLRWNTVTATSNTINAAVPGASLSVWIRRGDDAFSEDPDGGEDLVAEFFDGGSWIALESFSGGGAPGEILTRNYQLPAAALHAALQIRFRLLAGNGADFDYWHVDDVIVTETVAPPPLTVGTCDDFESGLFNWTIDTSGGGSAGISGATFNSPSNALFTRWGAVTVTSVVIDMSSISAVQLEMWIRRGDDAFSENPEAGEDLVVEYFNNASAWIALETFPGSGAAGEIFNRSYPLPGDAFHANFQIRIRQTGGSGADFDYYHVDDVCLTAPPDPIAEWRMDEAVWNGTTGEVADNTGNGNDGTSVNGTTTADVNPAIGGSPGTCRYGVFDGVNDYLEVADNALLDIADELTVTTWININSIPGSGLKTIVSKDINYEFHVNASGQIFWWWGGGARELTSNGTVTAGTWHHIAIVYSATGGFQRIYIDGVQDANTNNQTANLTLNNNPFQVGGDQGFAGREFDGLLDEVRVYDIALSDSDITAVMNDTHPCPVPDPVVYYALDEDTWGIIIDSSGNGFDASALGSAAPDPYPVTSPPGEALTADPGTCGAGFIPVTAGTQAIATPVEPDATIGNTGSIAFWYSGNSNWDDSTDRMLFDASNNLGGGGADKHFYLVKRGGPGAGANNGSLRFAIEDSADTNSTATTGQFTFAANTWVHITVTWDLPNDLIQIYVNGALAATSTTNVNGVLGNTSTLYFGDQRMGGIAGTAGNYTTNSANGYFDEIKIFDSEISAGDIAALMTERHPCTAGPHHYSIVPNGTGVTCDALVIDVEAHDSLHGAFVPNNTTTITVIANAAAPANVTWSVTNPGINTGAFTDNGDGTANYTFTGTESLVQFSLRYPFVETFDIDVTDGTATDQDGVFEDDDAQFVEAIFRITGNPSAIPVPAANITTKISGKTSNSTGFGQQNLYLQAIRTDDESGSCVGVFQSQTATVQMAGECNNPTTCAGTAVTVLDNSASDILIGINNNGMVPPAGNFTDVTLDFDVNSAAPLIFAYADAGLITLHARYDIDPDVTTEFMFGGSNAFVVRPFAFSIESGDANFTAADATGTAFKKAGENFDVTVRSVVWQVADDGDNDGISDTGADLTDNAVTPNFGNETIAPTVNITHALALPTGGSAGTLSGGAGVGGFGSVPTGETTATLSFDEVGIIDLSSTHTNYLGSGSNITGTREDIGRFYPARFQVADNAPTFADACTAGTSDFTYMDQTFFYNTAPVLTVTALNTGGNVTMNYGDSSPSDPAQRFWKLSSALPRNYVDTTGHGPANFAGIGSASVTLSGDLDFDGAGTLALANDIPGMDRDSFLYTRTVEEGPFGASVDLTFTAAGLTDPDGACYDLDDDDNCDDYTHLTQGGAEPGSAPVTGSNQRFGRLVIGTGFGSELLPVPVPMGTEYFDGTSFITNTDDVCTNMALADHLRLSNPDTAGGAVQVGTAPMTIDAGSTSMTITSPLLNGNAAAQFSAPGSGNVGFVNITGNLDCLEPTIPCVGPDTFLHLLYDWADADGLGDGPYDDNPAGRVDFGVYEGPRTHIYTREPW